VQVSRLLAALVISFATVGPARSEQTQSAGAPDRTLAEIGLELGNPVSDLWAHFAQLGISLSDGDFNEGSPSVGGFLRYEPTFSVPLYGGGDEAWRLVVRPTIPLLFEQPVADNQKGFVILDPLGNPTHGGLASNQIDHKTGLGDSSLPLLVTPPSGSLLLGVGPSFLFPTSTKDDLGKRQFGVGPAGVLGWKTRNWIGGVYPQYIFGIGSRGDQGDTPDLSQLSLRYFFFYNLPNDWQVGFDPTITYDDPVRVKNRWNVPVGLLVAKTVRIAGRPVKLQFGAEYSAIHEEDFGRRWSIRFDVIPVVKSLINGSIFGGG